MKPGGIKVRLMAAKDFDQVAAIDEKVLKFRREGYYELKFEKLLQSNDYIPTSLVAETADGKVVGFIMGELFIGEYGISREGATLDTIGVDPDFQKEGIGELLLTEFFDHLRSLGVQRVNTLVDSGDARLTGFFAAKGFTPSKTVNLELSIRKKD